MSDSKSSIQALGRGSKWHLGLWLLLFSLIAKRSWSLKALGESGTQNHSGVEQVEEDHSALRSVKWAPWSGENH